MKVNRIGLRLEDKNEWERRVALIPADVRKLTDQGLEIHVERFPRRAFSDAEFEAAGAVVVDDLSDCDLVMGIKEMPVGSFRPGGAYLFFSHTIKGQPVNMKMLAELVEKRCTLLDFETVVDEAGRRLLFFGRYAGLAGMIDTLWTFGRRLQALGHPTPLLELEPAHRYPDLEAAKSAVSAAGRRIAAEGLPELTAPAVIGFAGYGHVSQGAQEIFDLLPHLEVTADELAGFVETHGDLTNQFVKVVYKEKDLVEPTDAGREFDLQDYYDHGERYRSRFEPHLKLLTVLVNGVLWNARYPKLADADQLKELFAHAGPPRLLTVGDITCDIDGSLACTVRDTEPGDPVYLYQPETRETPSGFDGPGLAVMAVGNLPCELPRESSIAFSQALTPLMPAMAKAELEGDFEQAELPDPIRRSVILWQGEFTPNYGYMQDFLR
ncbi:MAG: hypothetical protein GY856_51180 [bacterium]|nr:hypothetical protein [bacterium]